MFIPFITKSTFTIIVQNESIQDSAIISCQFSTWCMTHSDYEPLHPHCAPESVSSLPEPSPLTGVVPRAGNRAEVQSHPCWGGSGLFWLQKVFLHVKKGHAGCRGCFNIKGFKRQWRSFCTEAGGSRDQQRRSLFCLSFIFSLPCFLSFQSAASHQHQKLGNKQTRLITQMSSGGRQHEGSSKHRTGRGAHKHFLRWDCPWLSSLPLLRGPYLWLRLKHIRCRLNTHFPSRQNILF